MTYYVKEIYRTFELVGDFVGMYDIVKEIIESHGAEYILNDGKVLFQVTGDISVYDILNDVFDRLTIGD